VVFCGSTNGNLTKEHVIPKWAHKAFDIHGGVTIHALDDPAADRALVERLPDLNIVLNDRICATCNNEWLAGLESKVRPLGPRRQPARARGRHGDLLLLTPFDDLSVLRAGETASPPDR
jgi:hypothetical protein